MIRFSQILLLVLLHVQLMRLSRKVSLCKADVSVLDFEKVTQATVAQLDFQTPIWHRCEGFDWACTFSMYLSVGGPGSIMYSTWLDQKRSLSWDIQFRIEDPSALSGYLLIAVTPDILVSWQPQRWLGYLTSILRFSDKGMFRTVRMRKWIPVKVDQICFCSMMRFNVWPRNSHVITGKVYTAIVDRLYRGMTRLCLIESFFEMADVNTLWHCCPKLWCSWCIWPQHATVPLKNVSYYVQRPCT